MAPEANALFLAAGFGNRMKGYLQGKPKGLLELDGSGGDTIVGRLMEEISGLPKIERIAMITNDHFYDPYRIWLDEQSYTRRVRLINNGRKTNEDRRGAIGDLIFALDELGWIDSDVLVLPSDTLYGFQIKEYLEFAQRQSPVGLTTVVRRMDKKIIANRLGCAIMDGDRMTAFVEKPEKPQSDFAIIPFYYYPQALLGKIREYREAGGNLDAPSSIISWFIDQKIPVYGFRTEGVTLDVGTPEDAKAAIGVTIKKA